jgi:hypothetical protein
LFLHIRSAATGGGSPCGPCAAARQGQDRVARRLGPDRRKVGRHFQTDTGDGHFSYARDQDSFTAEAALDGIYGLRTSVEATGLDSPGVVSCRRSPRSGGPSTPP